MDLGEFHLCLNVADLERSIDFYRKLGFEMVDDHRGDHWAVMRHGNLILGLFEGHIDRNLLNFRGGDVEAIAREATDRGLDLSKPARREPDGSWSAELVDPDGNVVYLNTFPSEQEMYLREGRLIDETTRIDRATGHEEEA